MKGLVMWVLELSLGESLVVVDGAVANELDLWYTRDRLEIRVKNGLLRLARLVVAVAIALGLRVKGL